MSDYIHGYSEWEQKRLLEQARVLAPYIFARHDLGYCQQILEVGSGVGAQTQILLERYPELHVTGLEISPLQLQQAERNLAGRPELSGRWQFREANVLDLGAFDGSRYDAALFVWVLEHLPDPLLALKEQARTLRPGAKVLATEVFHDSLFLYPACPNVMDFWQKAIDHQAAIQGDANVGARLGNLFAEAGLHDIRVWPCPMHHDQREPEALKTILAYWSDLMRSAVPNMLAANAITMEAAERAQTELDELASHPEAVFYYASMQAEGRVA